MTQQEGFPDKPQLKLPLCLWQAAKEPLALGLEHLLLLQPWSSQGCFPHLILSNWMMTLGGTIRETTDSSKRQVGFQVHRIPFRNEFQKLFITKSIFQSPKNQDIWTRQQYIFTVLAFKGNTSLCWRGKTWVPNMQREVTWWHSDTLTRHFPFWASLSITACQISASKPALKM